MTPRQQAYVTHRAAGLRQEQSAIKAGYARRSAKVSASNNERDPAIREAIETARRARTASAAGVTNYADAETYLMAVVAGSAPPDPVRVGAAKALLPFLKPRERAPAKAKTPRELHRKDERDAEAGLLEQWAVRAAAIRQRMGR